MIAAFFRIAWIVVKKDLTVEVRSLEVLSTTIFFYFSVNLLMVMGLAPVVGIPLPLVSYGGSAVMTVMLCLGVLMGLERQQRTMSRLS